MARSINRLNARQVATIDKPGRYADGGNLYLQVSSFGTKAWLFRFTIDGKAREMGLGSLHTVSLAEAREKARNCRQQLDAGDDPIELRRRDRARRRAETITTMTFRQCAERYIRAHEASWRNAKHRGQWESTLETYVYPEFGRVPVDEVDTGLVMKVIEPLWATKTETASRLRGRIEVILDWATARNYRRGENPARWRGHLDKLLPSKTKVKKVKHHTALPYGEIGAFMAALRGQEGVAARGLEFLILTAARTGEVIGATWDEIDLDNKIWTIPAGRMKAKQEHRVPLSPAAVDLLKRQQEAKVSDYVFPGQRPRRPLSNMAFLKLLQRMKRDELTAHGFRSTFRDWVADCTSYPNEVAEMALAHTVSNKVEAAYRRGDLYEKRRELMNDWAEYCGHEQVSGIASNVVSLTPR